MTAAVPNRIQKSGSAANMIDYLKENLNKPSLVSPI